MRENKELMQAGMAISTAVIVTNIIKLTVIIHRIKKTRPYEILLLILSVSDTFVGISFFAFTYSRLRGDEMKLPVLLLVYGISGICLQTSVVTMLLISIDRLIAVRMPFRYASLVTRGRVLKAEGLIWFPILFSSWLPAILYEAKVVSVNMRVLYIYSGIFLIVIQCFFVLLYVLVIYEIIHNKLRLHRVDAQEQHVCRLSDVEKIAFNTCAMTVAAYVICSTPFAITILQANDSFAKIKSWKEILFVANSLANPLIYFIKVLMASKMVCYRPNVRPRTEDLDLTVQA